MRKTGEFQKHGTLPYRYLEMSLTGIWRSFAAAPLLRGLSSPLFYLCFCLGFLGMFFSAPTSPWQSPVWLIAAPFLEEFTWRALLQNELGKFLPSYNFISRANVITSTAFAGLHVLVNPSLLAALTFFPGLIFGGIWTKFHSLWLCGLLHLWYNLALRLF